MKQQNNDLFLILLIAIINLLWLWVPYHIPAIGIAIALPLVFLAPGYLLVEMLNQKKEQDGTKRLLLSIGLSLSIDIVAGFLLNIVPSGLTSVTWGGFLSIFTTICTLLCIMKRHRWQHQGYFRRQKRGDRSLHYKLLLLLLTLCMVILTFIYATKSVASQRYAGFTQFWLLLENHQPHACAIHIGLSNNEVVTTTYQIEVKENNQRAATWSPTVSPQHKWQERLLLPTSTNRTRTTQLYIVANLYRQQEPDYVYRSVQAIVSLSKITCFQQ